MSNTAYSFARTELKYLLSRTQYEAFCAGAAPYFAADAYGKTTICNLYYDTEDFELIRRSVEKPPYKEKLRLRSYGVPQENDTVFLEIKKKYNGTVYKRRISLALQNADAVLQGEAPSGGQIGREIQWFLHMHALAPRVFLAYERTAFFGKQDPSLRLTFDEALRYRTDCLSLRQGGRAPERQRVSAHGAVFALSAHRFFRRPHHGACLGLGQRCGDQCCLGASFQFTQKIKSDRFGRINPCQPRAWICFGGDK